MRLMIKNSPKLFIAFAFLFLLAAIYHLAAVFFKIHPDESGSSASRNILFAVINLICVYGIIKRPKWFVFAFAILLVQQYFSHGISLYDYWTEENKIDS